MSITHNRQNHLIADPDLARRFPANFIWGTATAAYQIEGATSEDGRGSSIWDDFAAIPGKTFQGDNGDIAVNHYHLVEEDIDLMRQLGVGAYRFSLSWPRILPQGRGTVNTAGLDFYDRLVDSLLSKGIAPFATLYHWDLPSPLEQAGGWLNRDTANAFADYAEIVAQRLGDRVAGWITLNEPWCSAYLGYGIGVHAPGKSDRQAGVDAAHVLLLGHGLAVPRLRANIKPGIQVGITLNVSQVYPANDLPETRRDVALCEDFSNGWFLDPLFRGHYPDRLFENMGVDQPPMQADDFAIISAPLDFLGINYYSRQVIRGAAQQPLADRCEHVSPVPEACYTDMGWEIYPLGLKDFLVQFAARYTVPNIYITENGAAFKDTWDGNGTVDDPRRVSYLHDHIESIAQAIEAGVPLRGYFVWSFMDNFEWTEGYSKRFGIVYVDYPTQTRVIKASGHWYAELLKTFRETNHS